MHVFLAFQSLNSWISPPKKHIESYQNACVFTCALSVEQIWGGFLGTLAQWATVG